METCGGFPHFSFGPHVCSIRKGCIQRRRVVVLSLLSLERWNNYCWWCTIGYSFQTNTYIVNTLLSATGQNTARFWLNLHLCQLCLDKWDQACVVVTARVTASKTRVFCRGTPFPLLGALLLLPFYFHERLHVMTTNDPYEEYGTKNGRF